MRRLGSSCVTLPDGTLECFQLQVPPVIDGKAFFEERARAEAKALEDAIRRQGGGGPREIAPWVPGSSKRGLVLVGSIAAIAAAAWFLSR